MSLFFINRQVFLFFYLTSALVFVCRARLEKDDVVLIRSCSLVVGAELFSAPATDFFLPIMLIVAFTKEIKVCKKKTIVFAFQKKKHIREGLPSRLVSAFEA